MELAIGIIIGVALVAGILYGVSRLKKWSDK